MLNASYVVIGLTLLCLSCFVGCAILWSRSFTLAEKLRSTSFLQGELTEQRAYLSKIDAWAKRINAREVMAERRNPVTGQRSANLPSDPVALKAELRKRAGITAGQPVNHT